MDAEVIAAWIALGGVIISVSLSTLIGLLSTRFNYKQLFAQTVSSNRMNWIDNFREEFSIFIGTACYLRNSSCHCKGYKKEIITAERARVKLLTRLNQDTTKLGNEFNEVFASRLNDINLYAPATITSDKIEALISLSRAILEPEWNRVKREAKGKK